MLAIFMPSWFGLRIYLLFSDTDDYRCIPGCGPPKDTAKAIETK